jgi:hypothetical protein
VYWNPDPQTGTANPHVLVLGESGFGKTYLISALLAELAQQQIVSVIFDYGQGFSNSAAPQEFLELAKPTEIEASREGIAINPLQIFPSDMHGPLNVAQRVAKPPVHAPVGYKNNVFRVFDSAGVYALEYHSDGLVYSVGFIYVIDRGRAYCPVNTFGGTVTLIGTPICADTSGSEIESELAPSLKPLLPGIFGGYIGRYHVSADCRPRPTQLREGTIRELNLTASNLVDSRK